MEINLLNKSKVAIIDNLLPDIECKRLADYAIYLKKNNIDIKNTADLDPEASEETIAYWKIKNVYLQFLPKEYKKIGNSIGKRYIEAFREYLNLIKSEKLVFSHHDIMPEVVHVYRENDTLDLHRDAKDYALVFYLNDQEEFTGGDLLYPELDIRISPKRGRLVIAPSQEIHEVLKITSGFRCSMTMFIDVV